MKSILRDHAHFFAMSLVAFSVPLTLVGCGSDADLESVEQTSSAITPNMSGQIMAFGGQYGSCIAVSGTKLTVEPCNLGSSAQLFDFVQGISPDPSGYVEIQNGGLCLGVPSMAAIGMQTCNRSVTQQWLIRGGQIVSAEPNTPTPAAFCLDILGANKSTNGQATVDFAQCNGTSAQVFWPAGFTLGIASTLTSPSQRAECLDLLANYEKTGGTLDDSVCNATNAQWWILNLHHQITLANSPSLCLGLDANPVNGLAQTQMQACNTSTANQRWAMTNASGFNSASGKANLINLGSSASECLDIKGDNNASPTTVDEYTCNGTAAQLWVPFLPPSVTGN